MRKKDSTMRKWKNISLYLLILSVIGCSHGEKKVSTAPDSLSKNNKIATSTLPMLDSNITIKNLANEDDSTAPPLDSSTIAKLFERHFRKEADLINGEEPHRKTDDEKVLIEAIYDTINQIRYKSVKATISYVIKPYGASSTCFQPDHALVIYSHHQYSIIDEGIIPDHFFIDSIQSTNSGVIVFGYDWNCSDHKKIRNFKLNLR
jgi:hypothetical protein